MIRQKLAILGLVAAFSFSACASSAIPRGVHLVPGDFVPGGQPDGNSVVFDAPRGLVVVDTGRHAEHTAKIIEYARKSNKPIEAVINTHWHLDHIGGNALIRQQYPAVHVYASGALQEALKGFLANYRTQLEEMIAKTPDQAAQKPFRSELAIIDAGQKLAPSDVVTSSGMRSVAGRNMQLNLEGPSVTAGDVWIFDPATRVLVSGDLVTLPAPFLDTACPNGWKAALDELAKVDFSVLIPGHGDPMSRKDFDSYRAAYGNLLSCAGSSSAKDACIDGWLQDLGPLLAKEDAKFTRALMDYYVDVLRGDPKKIAERCAE